MLSLEERIDILEKYYRMLDDDGEYPHHGNDSPTIYMNRIKQWIEELQEENTNGRN